MKKILLISIFVLSGLIGHLEASNLANIKSRARIEQMPAQTAYMAWMSTMVAVPVDSNTVIISSYPSVLHTFSINNIARSDNTKIEIINASLSTFTANPDILFSISGSTPNYTASTWDIYCDSGIAVNVTGTPTPSVTVVFRRK